MFNLFSSRKCKLIRQYPALRESSVFEEVFGFDIFSSSPEEEQLKDERRQLQLMEQALKNRRRRNKIAKALIKCEAEAP